jgi:hypothetical protein
MAMFSLAHHLVGARLRFTFIRTLLVLTASDQNLFQKQTRLGLRNDSLAFADVVASI